MLPKKQMSITSKFRFVQFLHRFFKLLLKRLNFINFYTFRLLLRFILPSNIAAKTMQNRTKNSHHYCLFFLSLFLHLSSIELTLTKEEELSLKQFFHAMVWGSEAGYVLYGDKPICMEGYAKNSFGIPFKVGYHLQLPINRGVKIWKQLQLPNETPHFLFINQENNDDYPLILFINKDALKKVFHQNEILFKYILGSELTFNKLLDEFKKKDFFTVLNHDNVLIGLVLGFGFENSLCVGRCEHLEKEIHPDKNLSTTSYFPLNFCCQKTIPPFTNFTIAPSFNYHSIQQEWETLSNQIEFASESLEKYSPKLIFGRAKNDLKCNSLVKKYESTQLKMIKILESPNWFEIILSHFYNQPVTIKRKNELNQDFWFRNEDWSKIIADTLLSNFNQEFGENETLLDEFIAGLEEAEKRKDAHHIAPFPFDLEAQYPMKSRAFLIGFKIWSLYKFNDSLFSLNDITNKIKKNNENQTKSFSSSSSPLLSAIQEKILENLNNHEKWLAISHFKDLQKTKGSRIKILCENKLYYHQINSGCSLIENHKKIEISYVLKTFYGHVLEKESHISIDLQRTIKAFRESLPKMHFGEKGILFIHPDWGLKEYLSPPYYSPYIIAEFEISSM